MDDKENAQRSLAVLDTAITKVSDHRSYLGAIQSRLTSTITNLGIQVENNAAANSRIRDTDFAEESAKMVQSNIVKQSGIAILGQANQSPQQPSVCWANPDSLGERILRFKYAGGMSLCPVTSLFWDSYFESIPLFFIIHKTFYRKRRLCLFYFLAARLLF